MDFDDRFDLDEFQRHFKALDLLETETDLHDLIRRTTENTRGGEAFSFKPTHMWIGTCRSDISREFILGGKFIVNARDSAKLILASFRKLRFDFRMFCQGQTIASLRPYEGILPFRDVIPGGVELRAQRSGKRVIAHLTLRSTRPPRAIVRLVPVLSGRDPIFDRQATEADFFTPAVDEKDAGIISPLGDSDRATVKIGLWLTHRFEFSLTFRQYKLLWQCMVRLRLIQLSPQSGAKTPLTRPERIVNIWPVELSAFELRYLVEGLLSYGNISQAELGSLSAALQHYKPKLWPLLLEGLFKKYRKGTIGREVKEVARCMEAARHILPHCILVRKCLVTPTRCLVRPPQEETSNSMLRAYSAYKDRFLRVQFVDEDDELPVTSETLEIDAALMEKKGIFARLRRALQFGLCIAGRHYVFLCFGESQVKERGCWMISETDDFTVRNILDWMGDLTEERIIAKHAARQGLALSTTREANIQLEIMHDLPDITITHLGARYTFTDGAGHCSQALADRCSVTFGHGLKQASASAVQVRIGGSKGVLTVVPDNMIGENSVRLRKSMIKFKSSNQKLNVIKVAAYGEAYLNRQIIILLEAQGVPAQVLLKIFEDERIRIESLEKTFNNEVFSTLTTFPLARAISSGFKEDPLIQDMLRVLKCRLLSDMKWKARIHVPEGAYLMGVADETNTLRVGQVFCQLDCPSGHQVITGSCVIYRNPCLHPGDVRLVKAVDNSALSHLKNVVVFPTVGTRDLPSMMGGGDLDGDHYTILWDRRLLIPREHKPGDYTAPTPIQVPIGQAITVDDTKKFWLDYITGDILGMVCNAHMALADQYEEGPHHPDCLHLAALASKAVDFSKTGVRVHRDEYVRSESYPDFMGKGVEMVQKGAKEKKPVATHESQKVLGKMFRSIDPDPVFEPVEKENPPIPNLSINGLPSTLCQPYLRQAGLLKTRYDFELNGLLLAYNICEAECIAGILLRSRKRRIRSERDYSLRVAVREAYSELASFFNSEAIEYQKAHPVTGSEEGDRRAWALACYLITYDASYSQYLDVDWTDVDLLVQGEDIEANEGSEGLVDDEEATDDLQADSLPVLDKRYSFPWLFHKELFLLLEEKF